MAALMSQRLVSSVRKDLLLLAHGALLALAFFSTCVFHLFQFDFNCSSADKITAGLWLLALV